MPYYSAFWDKHYSDIGNCCMTKPLTKTNIEFKGKRYKLVDCINVDWMRNKKLKWFGWDWDGYVSWTTHGGMIYQIDELELSELGKDYVKENGGFSKEIGMLQGAKGSNSKKEYYEWEVYAQSKCNFCKEYGSAGSNDSGGSESSGSEKESDALGTDSDSSSMGIPDWEELAKGVAPSYNPVANVDYVAEAQIYANFGGPAAGGGKEKDYIPTLPYAPPVDMPTDIPPYAPPIYTPPVQNPVADNRNVKSDPDVITAPPSPFKKMQKKPQPTPPDFRWNGLPLGNTGTNPASVGAYGVTPTYPTQPIQNPYKNQYGRSSTTLINFRNHFRDKSYNQIITGRMNVLTIPNVINFNVPNFIEIPYNFVDLSNGKQVDMIHFLVVGQKGNLMGTANEIKQIFTSPKSAFYQQDLYSNKLGIIFFKEYADRLNHHPEKISDYIFEFLSNPINI